MYHYLVKNKPFSKKEYQILKTVSRKCFRQYSISKLWNNRIVTNKNGMLGEKK